MALVMYNLKTFILKTFKLKTLNAAKFKLILQTFDDIKQIADSAIVHFLIRISAQIAAICYNLQRQTENL